MTRTVEERAISGADLATARQRAGLTRKQLGREVGVTWRTVQAWEIGRGCYPPGVPASKAEQVREALGSSLTELAPEHRRFAGLLRAAGAWPAGIAAARGRWPLKTVRAWLSGPVAIPAEAWITVRRWIG